MTAITRRTAFTSAGLAMLGASSSLAHAATENAGSHGAITGLGAQHLGV